MMENGAPTRYFDRDFQVETVKILPGQYYAAAGEGSIATVLGLHVRAAHVERERDLEPMRSPASDGFVDVCAIADIPESRAKAVSLGGERVAVYRYDGRVSAVIGTHTHVPSADARVLPGGTAYVTDAGMTGPHGGVIGVEADAAIERFLRLTPNRFDVCASDVRFQAIALDVDEDSGRARAIERIDESIE